MSRAVWFAFQLAIIIGITAAGFADGAPFNPIYFFIGGVLLAVTLTVTATLIIEWGKYVVGLGPRPPYDNTPPAWKQKLDRHEVDGSNAIKLFILPAAFSLLGGAIALDAGSFNRYTAIFVIVFCAPLCISLVRRFLLRPAVRGRLRDDRKTTSDDLRLLGGGGTPRDGRQ